MLIFDMYLQPCVSYTGGAIIGFSDKNKIFTFIESKRHL